MKYTFTKTDGTKKTVEIADEWIAKTRRALGISSHEAIQMWLCDNDYITNEEQEELNQKAGSAGMRVQAKERKKPARKPDEAKRAIIQYLYDCMNAAGSSQSWTADNINIANVERIIAFSLGDDQYEITLSKKRKPKSA